MCFICHQHLTQFIYPSQSPNCFLRIDLAYSIQIRMSFGNIEVGIFYLKRLELYKREKPFEIFIRIPISAPDQRSKNTEFESRLTPLFDIRGSERQFNLDDHGFAVRRFDVALPSLEEIQQEFLKEHYFPEVERFVKREVGGVDRLSFFGFRVCLLHPSEAGSSRTNA